VTVEQRDLLKDLNAGRCPDCKSENLEDGPRGGASQNILCKGCGARFNVAPRGPQYANYPLIFAERI
jgi:transposase-like protein